MNEADDADMTCELLLGIAINAARAPLKNKLIANGACYNCEASLSHAGEFCDVDCRDDWQGRATRKTPRP